jgi:hypothetical protein
MTINQLLEIVSSAIGKVQAERLAAIIIAEEISVKDLIDLTFHKEAEVGFRAAWILEQLYTHHLDSFLLGGTYFLEQFAVQQNPSAQRHFAKILAMMTNKKSPKTIAQLIVDFQTDPLVEVAFSWLIDEETPVAVKSHCLNILANFCPKHPWIKEELIQTMDFLVDKESIAFYAKVKQIRKQLAVSSQLLSMDSFQFQ